jgi:hypothetical protein
MKRILLTVALAGFASVASAQLGGSDLGSTAPTPGQYDISQLLTTGDTAQLNDGAINSFYDNTTGGTGYVGTSFTTGANPGGYTLNSLAYKFGGGQPVGYAGGNDVTLAGGWIITIYKLSGAGNTTATPVYTNTVGAITGSGNTGADWIQTTGYAAPTLLPNTVYAWTIFLPNNEGYDDLAYATGKPYTGGGLCRIPPGGGVVTYFPADNVSATFDIGLSAIVAPLGGIDLGQTAPTPGVADASQLLTTGDTVALQDGALNNFYDNTTSNQNGATGYVGTSFTTGPNASGYSLNSLSFKFGGGQPVGYAGGNDTTLAGGWQIYIYQLSGAGNTTATLIYTNTVGAISGSGNTGADWIQTTGYFLPTLQPNTTYAWTIFQPSGYDDLAYATGTPYSGGAICRIQPGGGTVTYFPADADSATFDVGLTLQGYPSVATPTAAPLTNYALSPVVLSDTASGPGTLTYQWQTNSDTSSTFPPTGAWVNIPGATSLQITNIVPNPGIYYYLSYQLLVQNSAGSATSSVVQVTVYPANQPLVNTDISPMSIVTYVGGTATFSASFVGTLPMTNQWQSNTTGTFYNIANQTNASLTLTNVQMSEAGTYQVIASNNQGSGTSSTATLTVLAAPAGPTSAEHEAYQIYTNHPYAYWRLNETANPSTSPSPVQAYDYSGDGFLATYGAAVTTGNAGPQAPAFPGFSSTEVAAGTSAVTGGFLTVPPLNLGNTTNVTFTAWINPAAAQTGSTGLLFNRNGSDASGFGFNGYPNGAGMPCLGFTWNSNSSLTWGWNSGLYPVAGLWNFVAYVITPTNETTYLGYVNTGVTPNTTNFLQASITLSNNAESFSTVSDFGSDPSGVNRTFNGSMTEVALYTNSLGQGSILSLFLTGLGSGPLPPTAPSTLPSYSLFAGDSFQLNATAGGSPTITYQWKASGDGGVTFTNLPNAGHFSGVTTPTLSVTGISVDNALEYEAVATSPYGTSTSGVSTLTVTAVPNDGIWTVNFQLTNATAQYGFVGLGSYTGRGVLGTGTFWNPIPDTASAFTGGNWTNTLEFRDDGVTHSGIYASINGGGFTSSSAHTPAGSIATLLDQYCQVYGNLTLTGVPDGVYNMVFYGIDGSFANAGLTVAVNGVNGTQTLSAVNQQASHFSPGDNTLLFTNVEIDGGTLTTTLTTTVSGNSPEFNGLQLQLVSYDSSITNITLGTSVTNNTITFTWPEGVLQSATNVTGPWTSIVTTPPYTVTTTGARQFFRLRLQ